MVAEELVDWVGFVVAVGADVVLDGVDGEEVEWDDDRGPEERGEGWRRRGPGEIVEVVGNGEFHGAAWGRRTVGLGAAELVEMGSR